VRVSPREPVIGDPVVLDLEVRAAPDVELLMPEFGEGLGRFEIVDFAPSEELSPSGGTIGRQRYRLQAARSGTQTIPPLRIEFVDRRPGRPPAPEGEDAYELLTERIDLEIGTVLPADAPLELRPARAPLPPLREPLAPWWAWAAGAAALLAVAAPLAWRALLAVQARQRQRSAYEIARGELDALLRAGRPSGRDPRALDRFFVELSSIVRRYLENRFALHAPELTTEEFLAEMQRSPDLARSHQDLLSEFLRLADLVKFAGFVPGAADVERSTAAAERFLDETREPGDAGAGRPAAPAAARAAAAEGAGSGEPARG